MLSTINLARDYSHFALAFFGVISTSAQHIYISALPLSPQKSAVHQLYKKYACPLVRVVQGLPITWDSVLATVYHEDYWRRVAWSPCNKFTAVAGDSTIEILDATTLEKLNTFYSQGCSFQQLGFSSDGCTLIHFSDWGITSWDLQTGVPVSSVHPENLVLGSKTSLSFAHSIDGKILAVSIPSPSPLDNDPILWQNP